MHPENQAINFIHKIVEQSKGPTEAQQREANLILAKMKTRVACGSDGMLMTDWLQSQADRFEQLRPPIEP